MPEADAEVKEFDGYKLSGSHEKNQPSKRQSSEGEEYDEDDFEEEELGDDHGDEIIDYGDEDGTRLDGVQFDDGSGGYDDELLDEAQHMLNERRRQEPFVGFSGKSGKSGNSSKAADNSALQTSANSYSYKRGGANSGSSK